MQPCPHIVSYYGSWAAREAKQIHMVLEYMHGGSLQQLVDAGGVPSERLLQHAARCCLQGLAHMESHETVHRDIKPANILVNHGGDVKLGDLGLACHLQRAGGQLKSGTGTALYLSPERIASRGYSFPADIWALGISLFALATGVHPIQPADSSFLALEETIIGQPAPSLPAEGCTPAVTWLDGSMHDGFSPSLRDLLSCMLRKEPAERWGAERLLGHRFFIGGGGEGAAAGGDVRDELLEALGVRKRTKGELQLIVRAVHGHQKHAERPPTAVATPEAAPATRASSLWRKAKTKLVPHAAAVGTGGRSSLEAAWEGLRGLAESLDLTREEVFKSICTDDEPVR